MTEGPRGGGMRLFLVLGKRVGSPDMQCGSQRNAPVGFPGERVRAMLLLAKTR